MSTYQQNSGRIFQDFSTHSKKEWEELVKSKMADGDFEKFINGRLSDGVAVRPYYSSEDFKEKTLEKPPFSFMLSSRSWSFQEIVYLKDSVSLEEANLQILKALEGGVESVLVDLSAYTTKELDTDILLKGVFQNAIDISFKLSNESVIPNSHFLSGIRGTLYINPLESYMLTGIDYASSLTKIESLLKADLPNFRCLPVSGEIFTNGGAEIIEEVALTCNLLLEYLDYFTECGFNARELFRNLEISLCTRSAYLADIAKFRAIHILLEKIVTSYSVELEEAIPLRAISAAYNKANYDHNTNLLRNTTEAMAAIIGNCQKICLTPHGGYRRPDNEFGRRMARNVSHLLRHESHLGLVQDPLKGSYALESLTSSIADKAWSLFCQVEAEGGLLSAFETGKLLQMISKSASDYLFKIRTLRKTAVGANRYVPPKHPSKVAEEHFDSFNYERKDLPLLTDIRGPAVIENIRKMVDEKVSFGKSRPLIGMISLSESSKASVISVRMAFVEDILTSIGLKVTRLEGNLSSAQIFQDEFSALVVVGDDEEYRTVRPDELKAKTLHFNKPLIIAGYPKKIAEGMSSFGVFGFIHAKMDVPAFADELLKQNKFFDL